MPEPLEHFKLPREDWYDEAEYDNEGKLIKAGGRIYKDRLIENFNAIESKLLELINLKLVDSKTLDVSGIDFPDVSLNSPSDRIVNLRSFVDILHLKYFPLELKFKAKTCVKMAYYDRDYVYKTIENIPIDIDDNKPYLYFDTNTETLFADESYYTPENCICLGFYSDDRIIHIFSNDYADINALFYLAYMNKTTYNAGFGRETIGWGYDTQGVIINEKWLGGAKTDVETNYPNRVVFLDLGRLD